MAANAAHDRAHKKSSVLASTGNLLSWIVVTARCAFECGSRTWTTLHQELHKLLYPRARVNAGKQQQQQQQQKRRRRRQQQQQQQQQHNNKNNNNTRHMSNNTHSPLVHRSRQSPALMTNVPGSGGAATQPEPSGFLTSSPPESSCFIVTLCYYIFFNVILLFIIFFLAMNLLINY